MPTVQGHHQYLYDTPMDTTPINAIVVLGPTASGKTRLGARLASTFGGEIISADSRQVYRGLDIGSGKDLDDYIVDGKPVPYHLIDIVDLDHEFNVFEYQRSFFDVFADLSARNVLPFVVGGTGLYVESVLRGYRMVEVPENPDLRARLSGKTMEELCAILGELRERVHNTTDLHDRERLVRAIEIASCSRTSKPEPTPEVRALVLGTRWPRPILRKRIYRRLKERLEHGLIEEVEQLVASGVSWEKLHFLGLEYRFVADYLQGTIRNRNDLLQKLASAIAQFAKRQDTWFRRMERNGTMIQWIDKADYDTAEDLVRERLS